MHVCITYNLYNIAILKAEVAYSLQAQCILQNSYIKYQRVATKKADTSLAELLHSCNNNANLKPKLAALLEIKADKEACLVSEAQKFACQS